MATREDLKEREAALRCQWDVEKNGEEFDLKLIRSKHKHWWVCKRGHSWLATGQRITLSTGCPVCANKQILEGFNDFESQCSSLMRQWDYELNNSIGLNPRRIFPGARIMAHWFCDICGGRWRAQVYSRTQGNGCPYCSNRKVLPGFNDLLKNYPEIAQDWHHSKNGDVKPDNVIAQSHHKFYWICSNGHDWKASVKHRVQGTGCPVCARAIRISKGELELLDFVRLCQPNIQVLSNDRKVLNGKELDILLPSLDRAIEFNGNYWHSEENIQKIWGRSAREHHTLKLEAAHQAGIDLVFVWQDDWKKETKLVKQEVCEFLSTGAKSPRLGRLE